MSTRLDGRGRFARVSRGRRTMRTFVVLLLGGLSLAEAQGAIGHVHAQLRMQQRDITPAEHQRRCLTPRLAPLQNSDVCGLHVCS